MSSLSRARRLDRAHHDADGHLLRYAGERGLLDGQWARSPMLFHAGVTLTAMLAIFLERVREALSAAERQLFFQGWHLRQLLPEWPPGEQNLGVVDLRPCEDVYFL